MWSSANDSKEGLVVTTAIRGDTRLVESSENNVGAQQYVKNRTKYRTEWGGRRERWRKVRTIDKLRQYWHSRETKHT